MCILETKYSVLPFIVALGAYIKQVIEHLIALMGKRFQFVGSERIRGRRTVVGSIRLDSGGAWNRLIREAQQLAADSRRRKIGLTPQNMGPPLVGVGPHRMYAPSLATCDYDSESDAGGDAL